MRIMPPVIVCVLILATSRLAAAQDGESAHAARELVSALAQRGAEAAAAEHPKEPGTFSAVLHLPGVQLLGITTTHPVPEQIRSLIARGEHRQVYVELQTAGARDGRVFVQDLRADGLRPDPRDNEPFDVVSHNAARDVAYDGDWARQQMSRTQYRETFARDEKRYAVLLQVVTAGVRQPQSTTQVPEARAAEPR